MQSLTNSIDTLQTAKRQLDGRYRDAMAVWRDQTAHRFAETYWIPLDRLTLRTDATLRELSKTIDDVRRRCQDL
jgi:hypothetical protein